MGKQSFMLKYVLSHQQISLAYLYNNNNINNNNINNNNIQYLYSAL